MSIHALDQYDVNAALSRNVGVLLRLSNTTQQALADHLGINQNTLSRKLTGESRWTAADLAGSAVYFDLPLGVLTGPTPAVVVAWEAAEETQP